MRGRLRVAAVVLLIAGPVAAQTRPASEEIGSWVLSCPAEARAETCLLRHRSGVLAQGAGGTSAALEVLYRGGQFIPVVAIRGLSTQAALGGVLAVQASVGLRFDGAPRIELSCGPDGAAVVCAPGVDAAPAAAGQLVSARSVLVQVRLGLPGGWGCPSSRGRWNWGGRRRRWRRSARPHRLASRCRRWRGWIGGGSSIGWRGMQGSSTGWRICCQVPRGWLEAGCRSLAALDWSHGMVRTSKGSARFCGRRALSPAAAEQQFHRHLDGAAIAGIA